MDGSANPKNNPAVKVAEEPEEQAASLPKLFLVASIAAGIQFGWALQLSLLTPYVQLLGIPHKYASLIWLCGPISGMIVQPLVGYNSDKCTSRFGRRRPFIVGGAFLVVAAVVLIGFAADIGRAAGDPLKVPRARAIACFVVGFWILDVANNMLQGPCRAFLADLSAGSVRKTRTANAYFSLFMAVGNVLGYAAGSYTHLYRMFPFTKTSACDIYCANLKSCFFLSIALLASVTTVALVIVPEKPFTPPEDSDKSESRYAVLGFLRDLQTAIKELPRPMIFLLVVTFLNWVAWFPFLLFDTDWMGKEVFGGTVGEGKLYDRGVRAGALGLMINSVVLGFSSVGTDYLARKLGGVKKLWGFANFLLALCLAFTVLVTRLAESSRRFTAAPGGGTMPLPPSMGVKVGAWTLFAVLGIPLSVTYSIPFALASIYSSSSGKGQGLSLGVLNLAIVIPQMIVSILAGPWDDLFGGGNIPAFVVGAIAAALSGIVALTMLPSPPPDVPTSKLLSVAGGGH